MRIKYKEPYWVKFSWEMDDHHDNQYVTNFDKNENSELKKFLLSSQYAITVSFKIKKIYKKDEISMVFGKPGKNLGLSYNESSKTMAFEFWTDEEDGDKFYFLPLLDTSETEIEGGVTITIVRDNNKIILYKNFVENNSVYRRVDHWYSRVVIRRANGATQSRISGTCRRGAQRQRPDG